MFLFFTHRWYLTCSSESPNSHWLQQKQILPRHVLTDVSAASTRFRLNESLVEKPDMPDVGITENWLKVMWCFICSGAITCSTQSDNIQNVVTTFCTSSDFIPPYPPTTSASNLDTCGRTYTHELPFRW